MCCALFCYGYIVSVLWIDKYLFTHISFIVVSLALGQLKHYPGDCEVIRKIWIKSFWFMRRHQMETFSELLALRAWNSPVTGEFPAEWPVTRSFDVFFDLRLNKRFSKQSWSWWFEMPSCSLWRHCNVTPKHDKTWTMCLFLGIRACRLLHVAIAYTLKVNLI